MAAQVFELDVLGQGRVRELGMAEHSAELGFTGQDREVLITLKVKMDRLETDVRDGLKRINTLEADRVGRKDLEDLLQVVEQKVDENESLVKKNIEYGLRLSEVEKLKPDVEYLKKYFWMAVGGLAVLQILLSLFVHK